jgi:uncharacterized membrane protein YsdA (DUF1294 family)
MTPGLFYLLALLLYVAASVSAFMVFAWDKRAAIRGRRRVPEARLHLISLLGGWPGAWLAQMLLRHKTQKRSFRATFYATVVANCLLLGAVTIYFAKDTVS